MKIRDIAYEADGRQMLGTYVVGEGHHRRPGVLVAHEGPGLDDHAKSYARRLADLGYAAFALDYHGGGKWLDDRTQMMSRIMELMGAPDRIVALGQAGLNVLTAQDEVDTTRLAAIGFCFGGTMALHMARAGVPLKAAVGFHAGLATIAPAAPGAISAKILALIGADDPMIPQQQRADFEAEMRAAGADWQLQLYGGVQHSYTNPGAARANIPGIVYEAAAESRAWTAMRNLFDETF